MTGRLKEYINRLSDEDRTLISTIPFLDVKIESLVKMDYEEFNTFIDQNSPFEVLGEFTPKQRQRRDEIIREIKRIRAFLCLALPSPSESIEEEIKLFTVTEAIRSNTCKAIVRGNIMSIEEPFKTITEAEGICSNCMYIYSKFFYPPEFYTEKSKKCPKCDGGTIYCNLGFTDTNIVQLENPDSNNNLERLKVFIYGKDTLNVGVGETVQIKGVINVQTKGGKNPKFSTVLHAEELRYEGRKIFSLTEKDKEAIERFTKSKSDEYNNFGNNIIDRLANMFAPSIIGFNHVKKGLLFSAASTGNDLGIGRNLKRRTRIHSLLIGDSGLAKSPLLKEVTKIVPNSRYESGQSSSGLSLTAMISKEGDSTVLRLGPIPMAKESICAINEFGRMPFGNQDHFLDVMEEGEFSMNKYGINQRIKSPTTIVASANAISQNWNVDPDGRINLDDIPAIKPILDRFDLLFIFRTNRNDAEIRKYAYEKSIFENVAVPDYNEYLIKHIMYSKQFNPKLSDEAIIRLNEYYIQVARRIGSPRIRETLFRIAMVIAKLNLKNIVDAEDARQACEFYNVVLNEYDQIVNIPADPRDIVFEACKYKLEITQGRISFEELLKSVCLDDEYNASYIGNIYKIDRNKKARVILKMLLNHSQVRKLGSNPIVLQWVPKKDKEESSNVKDNQSDLSDLSDPIKVPPTEKQKSKAEGVHEVKVKIKNERGAGQRSDMADRSDSKVTTTTTTFPPKCYYCKSNGFRTEDEYERHGIRHRKPLYPSLADIEKLGLEPQDMPWEQKSNADILLDGEENVAPNVRTRVFVGKKW